MASIYDEINSIKKQGSTYDNGIEGFSNVDLNSTPSRLDLSRTVRDTSMETLQSIPHYIGVGYDLEDFGSSQYDNKITPWREMQSRTLEDLRAERQPWYDQWANNLANMGVAGVTTFADSFAGTAAGLINMAFEPFKKEEGNLSGGERLSNAFISNPVSLWLNSINKSVKDNLPTYSTDEYRQNQADGKWWKNMGTSQFWGENIIENAGFTLGMVASGKVSNKLLSGITKMAEQSNIIKSGINTAIQEGKIVGEVDDIYRKVLAGKQSLQGLGLSDELTKAVKYITKQGTINTQIATAMSVVGEARQEGINSSLEYGELMNTKLNSLEGKQELLNKTILDLYSKDEYKHIFNSNPLEGNILDSIKPEYLDAVNQKVQENHTKAEQEIKDAQGRIAGMDFALNFPILYASNLWQFGRTFSKGYDTQKGLWNTIRTAITGEGTGLELEGASRIIREGDKYAVRNTIADKIKRYGKLISNPLVEANEEMMQAAAQTSSTRYAGAKLNSFMGYKLDPESEQKNIGVMNSIWNGIIDTYTDPAKYQEGFSGLIMGGMGSLNFTFTKNRLPGSGNAVVDIMSNVFDGGIWNDIRESRAETQDLQAASDAINKRLRDPEFINYYQGLIRHDALERNKTEALDAGDKFSFLNSDHAQLISDVIMFEKAGKLQDLYDNIDKNIQTYSTSDKTEISELATALREQGKSQDGSTDLFKDKTDEEIVKDTLKFNQDLKSSVDTYRGIANNLRSLIGHNFQGEEMDEMVYLFSQIDNFEKRASDLSNSLIDKLSSIKSRGLNIKLFTINLDNSEKRLTLAEIISGYKNGSVTEDDLRRFIYGYKDEEGNYFKGDDYMNNLLINDTLKRKGFIKKGKLNIKEEQFQKILKSITPQAYEISKDFTDLAKIVDTRSKLVNTYNKFIGAPVLLREKLNNDTQEAATEQDNLVNNTTKESLKNAQSIAEIKQLVQQEIEKGNKSINRILAEMSVSDNPDYSQLVSEYKQMEYLNAEVNNSNAVRNQSEDIKKGVQQLYDIIKNKSDDYNELTNPAITEDDLFALGDRNTPYTQEDKELIRDILLNSLEEIKDRDDKYNSLSRSLRPAPVDPGTHSSQEKTHLDEKPVGNISTQQSEKDNWTIQSNLNQKNNEVSRVSTNKVWNNGTFEIDIDVYNNTGRIELQSNSIYKPAVEYLKSIGAFDYVNSGKLTKGTKVYFLASQDYWNELIANGSNSEWVNKNKPLLLVVEDSTGSVQFNNKNYQVVGTFNSNLNSNIHKKTLEGKGDNQVYLDDSISTKVTNITPGRLAFNTEKLLSSLQGKKPDGEIIDMLFGIATDTGMLETNLDRTTHDVFNITPANIDYSNSGRLYLLTKSSVDGYYIPTAVRVKTLNEVDISRDTSLFNELKKSLVNVSKAALSNNEEMVANAVHDLRNILYVGSKAGLSINLRKETQGVITNYNLVISKKDGGLEIVNAGYSKLLDNNGTYDEIFSWNTEESITNNLIKSLSNLKAPFQINKNCINGKWNVRQSLNYNDVLLTADILTTNLSNNYVEGSYFNMNPLDANFTEVTTIDNSTSEANANVAKPTITQAPNETFGKTITIPVRGTFLLTEKGEVVNENNVIVSNPIIVNAVKTQNWIESQTPEHLKTISFNGIEAFKDFDNPFYTKVNYVILPSGAVFNGSTVFSPTHEIGVVINELYNKRKSKPVEQLSPAEQQTEMITKTFNAMVNSVEEDAVNAVVDRIKKEGSFDMKVPQAIEAAKSNPRYNYIENPNGTIKVTGILGMDNVWYGTEKSNVEDDDLTLEEKAIPLFGSTQDEVTSPPSPRERRRPCRNWALNNEESKSTLTQNEIQNKIDENRDYQKDNCNGIASI